MAPAEQPEQAPCIYCHQAECDGSHPEDAHYTGFFEAIGAVLARIEARQAGESETERSEAA